MKYIRIFIISGLFFGVWMGIIYSFQMSNLYIAWTSASVSGIVFGFLMAAFTYFSDQKLKKKGLDISNTSPRQSRKISVHAPVSEVISVCERAILSSNRSFIKNKK